MSSWHIWSLYLLSFCRMSLYDLRDVKFGFAFVQILLHFNTKFCSLFYMERIYVWHYSLSYWYIMCEMVVLNVPVPNLRNTVSQLSLPLKYSPIIFWTPSILWLGFIQKCGGQNKKKWPLCPLFPQQQENFSATKLGILSSRRLHSSSARGCWKVGDPTTTLNPVTPKAFSESHS